MRYKNESKDLKLYAVAGTQTVLLSFDIARNKLDGKQFIGFSVERKDKQGNVKLLNGSKAFRFPGNEPQTGNKKHLARTEFLLAGLRGRPRSDVYLYREAHVWERHSSYAQL
jgi:hypothetical protein